MEAGKNRRGIRIGKIVSGFGLVPTLVGLLLAAAHCGCLCSESNPFCDCCASLHSAGVTIAAAGAGIVGLGLALGLALQWRAKAR